MASIGGNRQVDGSLLNLTTVLDVKLQRREPTFQLSLSAISKVNMSTTPTEASNNHLNEELVSAIAELLDIENAEVKSRPDSTFIQLGGDSVKALQLTFQLDSVDLELDIESVLDEANSIQKLSQILGTSDGKPQLTVTSDSDSGSQSSFVFVGRNIDEKSVQEASKQINCSIAEVEELLPITSQQKLLWLGSLQQPGAYIAHWCFEVPDSVDIDRLRKAWLTVLHNTPALRVRFVLGQDNKLLQAVVALSIYEKLWKSQDSSEGAAVIADYGKPLVGYGIEQSTSGKRFHIYAHHALYDRWSMRLIFDDVRQEYSREGSTTMRQSFAPLLEPLAQDDRARLTDMWREFVGESFLTAAPDLAPCEDPPGANSLLEKTVTLPSNSATKAELITAAWAWVCSKQSNSKDISFGLTVWGRDVPVKGVPEMAFPAFRTLPLCVRMQPNDSVDDFLSRTKTTLSTLRTIQTLGYDEVSSISEVSRRACRYNSIVVVQSDSMVPSSDECQVLKTDDLVSFELQQGHQLVLECTPNKDLLNICLNYNPGYLATEDAEPLLGHFCAAIEALASGTTNLCSEIDLFGPEDEASIRNWTRPCEDRKTDRMYSMIEEHATSSPDSTAVWTTSSETTYGQLMESSRRFAQILQQRSATGHIGACFEKSTLAISAQIGVGMAGCAFIPMDPSNPAARLSQIVEDSDMTLLVCSKALASKFEGFAVPILTLDEEALTQELSGTLEEPSHPTKTAYIVYTSGSTGKPKGVVIQHEQISTSLSAQKQFFNINPDTRTLQFSSLAFDMSVHEIYMTLSAGGTVCIPTEAERFELDDFLARARTNYSMLTPSVAATLSDKSLAQISEISLCGEALPKGLIERVLNAGSLPWIVYGPTETTVVDLGHKASASTSRFNLGYSFAATAWIVDADDANRLAPVGIPGELAFSGYTLAAEYYKDPEKTDAAFRKGLQWTKKFPKLPLERVYLTGDLARYNTDGTIQFLGRLGGYTKINGNRVDLDEIQHVLANKCDLPEVSVLICPVNGQDTRRDMLLSFFSDPASRAQETDDCCLLEYTAQAKSKATAAVKTLEQTLPRYMMPSAFIPVNKIPLNTSGKLDAGTLRRLIESLDVEHLLTTYNLDDTDEDESSSSLAGDAMEQRQKALKDAWASVLSVPASRLKSSSHFVRMGGDSLRAMELAATLRKSDLSLHVADIFKAPTLRDMAEKVQQQIEDFADITPMFTQAEYDHLLQVAAKTLDLPTSSIETIMPCSSLQIQMLVASEQSQGSFLHRDFFELGPNVSKSEVQSVCRALTQQNQLLRTRSFVDPDSGRFLQVVLDCESALDWSVRQNTIQEYIEDGSVSAMGLGASLCRFALLESDSGLFLAVEMMHNIYDGYSHMLLLRQLQALIDQHRKGDTSVATCSEGGFERFLSYLHSTDTERSRKFWSHYLEGAQRANLGIIKPVSAQSITNSRTNKDISVAWKKSSFTTATYLRAAFALVLSRYASSPDIVFGATVNGRDLPVPGIRELAGPTFATLPVRLVLDPKESLQSLLSRVQKDSADYTSHQTLPTEEISRMNTNCKEACQFDSHLLIQPQEGEPPYEELCSLGYKLSENPSPMQLQIPFNLVVTAKDDAVSFEAIYNDAAIQSKEVDLLLDQMAAVLQQITTCKEETVIGKGFGLGQQNIDAIMDMQPNAETDLAPASTIPDLVLRHQTGMADKEALYSSELSLTYRELVEWSHTFARSIKARLASSGQRVIVCFEKSPWAIVAQLAIMLAGHAFVPIDPSWPKARRDNILEQTQSLLIVTSTGLQHTLADSTVDVLAIDPSSAPRSDEAADQETKKPRSSDVAYVLFTSGSTGTPKGVVVEHGAISRTVQGHADRLFTTSTRGLLFASFTFDASIMEAWSVLAAGGTLCIANETERISDLSGFIVRSKADTIGLTPTAAGLLDPTQLTNIKVLLLCGEKTRERDLKPWRGRDMILANAYGPTETCVEIGLNTRFGETDLDDIGKSTGGGIWICNPECVDEILPIGCVGEVVISGPVLAREYLNAPERTAERFVYPQWPVWTKVKDEKVFRTGDLARLDAAGRLHFIGRNDGQMKLNGMRVEAEEIESAIQHAEIGVKEVIASTFSTSKGDEDSLGNADLALYFVPDDGTSDPGVDRILPLSIGYPELIEDMHSAAQKALPAGLVPSYFVPITRIPSTTSGKADRKLLAQSTSSIHPSQLSLFRAGNDDRTPTMSPKATTPLPNGSVEAPSEAEGTLQSLWEGVLRSGSSKLHPNSHFIESGGDSVAAIRLAAAAKSKGLQLPVSAIYANPRLRDMAKSVEGRPGVGQRTQSIASPGAFDLLDGMEIVTPMTDGTPSPVATRGRQGDYFGANTAVKNGR